MPTTSRRDSCRASFIIAPPRRCCNFDMKICGCLALFFFGTQLWNCAKFSYAHDRKRERGGGEEYRYVRNIDGLPPASRIPVWQGISYAWNHFMCNLVQIYNVISFTFTFFSVFQLFLLFYLFAHFFLLCMPRVSETNSQHNFICRDFAYIWFWMFASSRSSSSENISPRGGLQNICAGQRDGCQLASSCCCSCRCVFLMKLCALIPHVTATQPRDRE